MNNNNSNLESLEFKERIAQKLDLNFEKDIFDLIDETSNIIEEKSKILEFNSDKNIELSELDTTELENIKPIKCYYISIRDKDDYDNSSYIIYDTYEEAKNKYNELVSTKTLDDWRKSSYTYFEDFCKPGDLVGEDIVNYFANSVPPITLKECLIQSGEPFSHELDVEDNKFKATYITFEKTDGCWQYKGNCFKNKTQQPININEEEEEEL